MSPSAGMAQIFTEVSGMPSRRKTFNEKLFGPYKGHVWALLWPFLAIFTFSLLLDDLNV